MCKAFSCLVTRGKKVYWKAGLDSHEDLLNLFAGQDANLSDIKTPPFNTFARVEIAPEKGDYLDTNFASWEYRIDEMIKPSFLTEEHKSLCYEALKSWTKEVYAFNIEEAKNPINPFLIKPPTVITEEHILLLKKWDSVRYSVWASVWASVWYSVGDSVRDSVWASVWASVGAYTGSLFPAITRWKYMKEENGYPFQSAVDLWEIGLVPSFNGKVWRLHGGEKGNILWEGIINP